MRDYLLEQGLWGREIDEVLSQFQEGMTEDDIIISSIYDSVYDLAVNYIDNVIGTLDHHINAVLDYDALGREIAESDDEYMLLTSGRVIEFEM